MRYQFGDFELATERYELRRNGIALHVEPLVFDLILFLLRSSGRVVSREEIVDGVWQGRLVSESTIDGCIKSARRILGDSGDNQSYIRTVRGRGFEFAARVTALDESSINSSREQTHEHLGAPNEAWPAGHPFVTNVPPSGTAPRPVLAVFPFANQSAETDDYLADGLTEDIVTNLSRFRDLRVIAAGSTLQFKGSSINVPEFCRQMRAAYVVQGSVRRAAGRIRITVQLIDGVSCVQLWGDRYDRDMCDIFDMQDEQTSRIAATLGVKMQDRPLERAMAKGPLELDSYDCVLRARRYTSALSAEMHAEARDLLERAVELDPLSSDAHALLANVYSSPSIVLRDEPAGRTPIGRALTHAVCATRLDLRNAYASMLAGRSAHFFRGGE